MLIATETGDLGNSTLGGPCTEELHKRKLSIPSRLLLDIGDSHKL